MVRNLLAVSLIVFLLGAVTGCEISAGEGGAKVKGSVGDVKVNTTGGNTGVTVKNLRLTGDKGQSINLGDVKVNANETGAQVNVGGNIKVQTDAKGAKVKVGNDVNVQAGEDGVNVKAGSASVRINDNGIDIKTGNSTADGILGSVLKNVTVTTGDDDDE